MRLLSIVAMVLLGLAAPSISAELFRYRGQADDAGTFEYVFESDEHDVPKKTVTKEKVAEIAANFMTTFYHEQVGVLETQEFRIEPVSFWLVEFANTVKGPVRQMFFVVVLPNGTVVEPTVSRQL